MNHSNAVRCMTVLVGSALFGTPALAQFAINWHTIDGGGIMESSVGSFVLSGTISQPDAGPISGPMTSGAFSLTGGFWVVASATIPIPGDCDADGDIDLDDHFDFELCLFGPMGGLDTGCACFDLDDDGNIDLLDFAVLQSLFAP